MKAWPLSWAFASVLILAGCGEGNGDRQDAPPAQSGTVSPEASSRTVSWFLENPAALASEWDRCRNDPGGIGTSAECINASEARRRQTAREVQDALK
ncbi:EexN family lipoprotein [Bosea sp. (in: a-proteobacteria)]|uniref:EexN family lipoprotein n=1 Tax=Bosea sp. (in: a-proteobacteria) TaxID=1871050 RepID=UPI003525746D